MSQRGKVTVVGSLNMDLVVKAERAPQKGETVMGEEVHFIPGGKGANQAVAAASLGAKTSMIGSVGDDPFGESLLSSLQERGVDTGTVKTVTEASTGIASILLSQGDNRITVVSGANSHTLPSDVEQHRQVITGADGVLLQLEVPLPAIQQAVELAKKAGKTVILNPAPARDLPQDLLEQVDYLTPNRSELELLSGISPEKEGLDRAMGRLLDRGVGHVVTTLGEDGAAYLSPGEETVRVPGHSVKAVDTTGAGDAFNAGLAVALAEGGSLEEAVRFAGKTAALAVTRLGAQSGMPNREEVESFDQGRNRP
ncbi:ribokinase [Paludifilum halophilum]|uniref:Ribokinase n=1 Tax=Paludifilum halophilum TaxID=1642702 RepID=A0A235B569_9BACL|nr:ribokinase [Paludifilum halophilum]OYD07109.1 ribokinase [Paludifilum halophilum]